MEHVGRRRDAGPRVQIDIPLTIVGILVTVSAGLVFTVGAMQVVFGALESNFKLAVETALFTVLAAALVYGNIAYQLARLGYLRRLRSREDESEAGLEQLYDRPQRPLHILIPAYREEPGVIRQTLLSAALQSFPGKHVVLLIDDSPEPDSPESADLLQRARSLPGAIEELLRDGAVAVNEVRAAFLGCLPTSVAERAHEAHALADLTDLTAEFFERLANAETVADHTDALFVEQILRGPARDHRERARQLRDRALAGEPPTIDEMSRAFARLAAIFDARVTSFERKRFVNLSHEPNKAMNLNTYIGLIGDSWFEVARPDGTHLVRASALDTMDAPDMGSALDVPASDVIVTLDADSLLLPDYVTRLVAQMQRPGSERVAVMQTPYSAVPGAPTALEQTAGATTDIQYIIHQGFTRHDSTFWVGANAVIRKAALDDIADHDLERGHPIIRFIQDRTVIEDTESTVDLVARGWQLVNYPARLSFSATPADFGALVIQRQRWANGGLIVLPKLIKHLLSRLIRGRIALAEGFMRTHYLVSIAATNIALLVMLAYPFSDHVTTVWLPIAAAPYFVLYARDLRQSGYRARDMFRVYALNLLLLPVNLAGVAKSLQQAVTRRKIPFGRTPKISGRTAAPVRHHLAVLALICFWLTGAASDLFSGRLLHGVFAGLNALFLLYAITRFVGWSALWEDVRSQIGRASAASLRAIPSRATR